jgi:hypothetical protein
VAATVLRQTPCWLVIAWGKPVIGCCLLLIG